MPCANLTPRQQFVLLQAVTSVFSLVKQSVDMERAVFEVWLGVHSYSHALDQQVLTDKENLCLTHSLLLEVSILPIQRLPESNSFIGDVWELHPSVD